MKRFIFIVAMALSLSACDNTERIRLRAPKAESADEMAATEKKDTLRIDTSKNDTTVLR
ncbi:MAG: hypothetical protein P0Y49_18505 [Candidatus Pedobacter colombiensis]|uniref:Lipoprotein n=1 Tax=Candidatus Pedobacter colombiensis TaxID=3121371 RepID=A0AAJ5W696_9SPHI|nr:hypothetical protein [Pedobacter sp.]WEK18772.1 MAG: hypothetical protein P0Y49_18505 [Pedobacter sp.]